MQWITMEETPIITDNSVACMMSCRYKDYFHGWRFTECEWCDGWHIWHPYDMKWTKYEESDWSSEFQWLKED